MQFLLIDASINAINLHRIYIYREEVIEETIEDMMDRYHIASDDKKAKVKICQGLLSDYEALKEMVFNNIQHAYSAVKRLEEIGMGKSILTSVEYIERLIVVEEKSNRYRIGLPGYKLILMDDLTRPPLVGPTSVVGPKNQCPQELEGDSLTFNDM